MQLADIHLPQIDNDEVFEELCKDILSILENQTFEIYGRSGQKQCGIDIISILDYHNNGHVVAQCKNYFEVSNKAFVNRIEKDFERTKELEANEKISKISKFIAMTTLRRDNDIINSICSLNKSLINKGQEIGVLFWGDIERVIKNNEFLIEKYYPSIVESIRKLVDFEKEKAIDRKKLYICHWLKRFKRIF